MRKQWSTEEKAYLTEHFANTTNQALADYFGVRYDQLAYMAYKLKLVKSVAFFSSLMSPELGKATRFKKGLVPYCKGKKQTDYMSAEAIERCKAGRFKAGHVPKNTVKNEGEIREWKDGTNKKIPFIHIAHGKWLPLYQYNWEKLNGPKPANGVFWCKDGNAQNTNASNWEIITRQEQVVRNSIHKLPTELKETIILRNKLNKKLYEYDQQQQRHASTK